MWPATDAAGRAVISDWTVVRPSVCCTRRRWRANQGAGAGLAVRASVGAEARGAEVVSARPCPDGGVGAAYGVLYQYV